MAGSGVPSDILGPYNVFRRQAHSLQQAAIVSQRCLPVGMLVACRVVEVFQDGHHPPNERLGFPQPVGLSQQHRQVVEVPRHPGMGCPIRRLVDLQGAPMQRLGIGKYAFRLKK